MSMGITSSYNNYVTQGMSGNNAASGTKTKETEKTKETAESSKSKSSKEYAEELAKLVPSAEFQLGSSFSTKKTGVTLTVEPRLLKKIQNDPAMEKEMKELIKGIETANNLVENYNKMTGSTTVFRHWYMDANGELHSFSQTIKKDELNERLRKEAQENAEKRIEKTRENVRNKAEQLAEELAKKFDGYSFAAANYSQGMKYGSSSTTNVAISPQFLSKMANDPELEAEYMKEIELMQELDKQFVAGQAARGWKVVAQGWVIDKEGGISSWSITTKDSNSKSFLQQMSERSNEIREKSAEKKKKQTELEEKAEAVIKEKTVKKREAVVGSTVDLSV